MYFYVFAFPSFLYFWSAGANLHLAVFFWIYFFLPIKKKKKKIQLVAPSLTLKLHQRWTKKVFVHTNYDSTFFFYQIFLRWVTLPKNNPQTHKKKYHFPLKKWANSTFLISWNSIVRFIKYWNLVMLKFVFLKC